MRRRQILFNWFFCHLGLLRVPEVPVGHAARTGEEQLPPSVQGVISQQADGGGAIFFVFTQNDEPAATAALGHGRGPQRSMNFFCWNQVLPLSSQNFPSFFNRPKSDPHFQPLLSIQYQKIPSKKTVEAKTNQAWTTWVLILMWKLFLRKHFSVQL